MRHMQVYIKVAGAFFLIVSLFLPLSSCDKYIDKQGNAIMPSQVPADSPLPSDIRVVKTYNYFSQRFRPMDIGSWFILAGFIWPAFMIAALSRLKGRVKLACRFLEVPLLLGSVVSLVLITLLDTRLEIGAYVAYTSIGVYSLGAAWADVDAFRRWKTARTTMSTQLQHPVNTSKPRAASV